MSSIDTPPPRPFPGGPLAIDLMNTRWVSASPGGAHVDWLEHDTTVRAFASEFGHDAVDVDAMRDSLTRTRALIGRLLDSAADVGSDVALDPELVHEIDDVLASARVTVDPAAPRLAVSAADPARALAVEAIVDAIELIRTVPGRVRSCEHDPCTIWFVDTSKAGRRRWCSMEICGNRAKARRHYQRHAHGGDGTSPAS